MRAPKIAVGLAATAAAVCVALSAPAEATFPGKNGRIAYTKHRFFYPEEQSDDGSPSLDSFAHVWTINPDGSAPRPFAAYAQEPRFSPGGGLVAFQDYLWRIFIKPISGSRGRKWRLAPRLGADSFEFDPAWSPFGGRLIFALERFEPRDDVYLHTIGDDGTRMHRLRSGSEPDWSIRNRIVFGADNRVATMAPGGGHLRRLRVGGSPRWSPDGRWIVFGRPLPRKRFGIAIMRADGSHLRTLTRGPWDGSPVWSPEGQHIAYVHRNRRKAREKIVVMRTDGTGRRSILTVRRRPDLAHFDIVHQDLDWQPLPF